MSGGTRPGSLQARTHAMRRLTWLTLGLASIAALAGATPSGGDSGQPYRILGELPVLQGDESGGRIKPFDTYARLAVKQIYGRENVKLVPESKDAPAPVWEPLAALRDW